MSDDTKSSGWWQTLPGIITSLTAAVTAVAGLVVAVKQTGWLDRPNPPAVVAPAPARRNPLPTGSSAPAPPTPSRAPGSAATGAGESSPPASPRESAGAPRVVSLPSLRTYKLGPGDTKATFTLLNAEIAPQTAAKDALTIRVRMMNHNRFDANFWSQSFRLIVDGVPLAPDNSLNEVVPAQSAKDGDVVFVVPRGTARASLAITYVDDRTEIPLDVALR